MLGDVITVFVFTKLSKILKRSLYNQFYVYILTLFACGLFSPPFFFISLRYLVISLRYLVLHAVVLQDLYEIVITIYHVNQ